MQFSFPGVSGASRSISWHNRNASAGFASAVSSSPASDRRAGTFCGSMAMVARKCWRARSGLPTASPPPPAHSTPPPIQHRAPGDPESGRCFVKPAHVGQAPFQLQITDRLGRPQTNRSLERYDGFATTPKRPPALRRATTAAESDREPDRPTPATASRDWPIWRCAPRFRRRTRAAPSPARPWPASVFENRPVRPTIRSTRCPCLRPGTFRNSPGRLDARPSVRPGRTR